DRAALARLRAGVDPAVLRLVPVARVGLTRGGEVVRSPGLAWSDVLREIGEEPARFFLLLGKADGPLDLDLEQAKRQSADDPLTRGPPGAGGPGRGAAGGRGRRRRARAAARPRSARRGRERGPASGGCVARRGRGRGARARARSGRRSRSGARRHGPSLL